MKNTEFNALSAFDSFKILMQIDPLLRHQPVTKSSGKCFYLSDRFINVEGTTDPEVNRAFIEREMVIDSVMPTTYPSDEEFKALNELGTAVVDLYHCHGGISFGSGRSAFHNGYQLKGIGRTAAAGIHDFYKDFSGTQMLYEAIVETWVSNNLNRIFSSGTIPIDFIVIPQNEHARFMKARSSDNYVEGSVRSIMGRQGSPLRIAHLEYWAGAQYSRKFAYRKDMWREIFYSLQSMAGFTPSILDEGSVRGFFNELLTRAIRLVIESRFLGLHLSYWSDNCDLYSRVFDCADMKTSLPYIDSYSNHVLTSRSTDPADFFETNSVSSAISPVTDFSLLALQGITRAIRIFTSNMNLGIPYDQLVNWTNLYEIYESQGHKFSKWLLDEAEIDSKFTDSLWEKLRQLIPLVAEKENPEAEVQTNLTDILASFGTRPNFDRSAIKYLFKENHRLIYQGVKHWVEDELAPQMEQQAGLTTDPFNPETLGEKIESLITGQ